MGKPEAVRVGDRFEDGIGKIWECIESRPFGIREFKLEGHARFFSTSVAQIRLGMFKRVLSQPTAPSSTDPEGWES